MYKTRVTHAPQNPKRGSKANCERRVNWFLGIDLLRQHRRRAGIVVGAGHIDRGDTMRSGG
jgi:hypothetical protein